MDRKKFERYVFCKLIFLAALLFFLIIIANTVSGSFGSMYRTGYIKRIEVNFKNQVINHGNLIKFEDTEKLNGKFMISDSSYLSESDGFITTENAGCAVKVELSGENLINFVGIKMVRGTYFNSYACQTGRKVVVISLQLAEKLFATHEVLGNEINLFGTGYKIVGVYENSKSVISFLGSDGNERIYIPFGSVAGCDTMPIKTIFIKDKSLENEPFRIEKVNNILKSVFGVDLASYRITDYYNAQTSASQLFSVFIFLIGVCCVCILAGYFIRHIKFSYSFFKQCMNNKYFFQAIISEKLKIILLLLISAAVLACIGMVLFISGFKCLIPPEYIPQDNIFDFGFYLDKIKHAVYASNASIGYIPSVLETSFKNTMIFIIGLLICSIVTFFSTLSAIKLCKFAGKSIYFIIGAFLAALPIALITSFVFSTACGLEYSLPIQKVIVLVIFFVLIISKGIEGNFISNKLFKRLRGDMEEM
jgi:hypothetical protein